MSMNETLDILIQCQIVAKPHVSLPRLVCLQDHTQGAVHSRTIFRILEAFAPAAAVFHGFDLPVRLVEACTS